MCGYRIAKRTDASSAICTEEAGLELRVVEVVVGLVDRCLQVAGVEDVGEVEEGALEGGDGEAVVVFLLDGAGLLDEQAVARCPAQKARSRVPAVRAPPAGGCPRLIALEGYEVRSPPA